MSEVVAIQRREGVVLAAVLAEARAADGTAHVSVVAEDGARFELPASQALVRFEATGVDAGDGVPLRLAEIRRGAAAAVDWRALHARVPEGAAFRLAELAAALALPAATGALAVALASWEAAPWFRREGALFVAAPRAEAEAKLARVAAARRAREEDDAVRAWWPDRERTAPPALCRGGLDALADFALRGQVHDTERGRSLAAHLDVAEPDRALAALVAAGVLEGDVNPAPHRAGLAAGFTADALAAAERLAATPVDRSARTDLTGLAAVAVDDAITTEVDDAVSVREADGALEVFVHISDVAALLPLGGALDTAARERTSSLYVPDAMVAMLPADAVARASLEAGVVREAVTGTFRLDADGRLLDARFERSLVRVTRRATYEATNDLAALGADARDGERLVAAATALRDLRRAAGAEIVSLPSLKVTADGGAAHVAPRHQATPGDLVVAELMLLYNREAARRLAAADAPAFYRTQGPPREPPPSPSDPLRELRLRRRFAATSVSIEPGRHHGVGADAYLQATSPIRRFADLVNQRQIAAAAAGLELPYRHADLERMVPHLLERERAVRGAADDRTDHWVARSYLTRAGGTIDGVLSRAPRRGMGGVWVPELCRELPLRAPPSWRPPPEGTAGTWRIARVAPWTGRIELEPAAP